MKRKTAYEIAIQALEEKQRRQYSFDHHIYLLFEKAELDNVNSKSAHIQYIRIDEAIEMLKAERDYKQQTFDWTYTMKQARELDNA